MLQNEVKSARLLAIYSELVSGQLLQKKELAQRFHVTERSIQRDMESLRCFFADQGLQQDIIYDRTVQSQSERDSVFQREAVTGNESSRMRTMRG